MLLKMYGATELLLPHNTQRIISRRAYIPLKEWDKYIILWIGQYTKILYSLWYCKHFFIAHNTQTRKGIKEITSKNIIRILYVFIQKALSTHTHRQAVFPQMTINFKYVCMSRWERIVKIDENFVKKKNNKK